MMFADGRGEYSLDKLLAEWIFHYPFPLSSFPSLLLSGFARKLITTLAISTLFLAAVTKLLNSGIRWMDGRVLQYHAQCNDLRRHILFLKRLIQRQTWFACLLAICAVLFELGSVVAVIEHRLAFPVFLLAAIFHVSIYFVLIPNYTPQTVSYISCVDWYSVFAFFQAFWRSFSISSSILEEYPKGYSYSLLALQSGVSEDSLYNPTMLLFSHFACWFCIFLAFCCLLKVELWPFTAIPMYSLYRPKGTSRYHVRTIEDIIHESLRHRDLAYPFTISWGTAWLKVILANPAPPNTPSSPSPQWHSAPTCHLQNHPSVLVDVRSKLSNRIIPVERWNHYIQSYVTREFTLRFDPKRMGRTLEHQEDYPATELLFLLREILFSLPSFHCPAWVNEKTELSLICNLPDKKIVTIASVPWIPSSDCK